MKLSKIKKACMEAGVIRLYSVEKPGNAIFQWLDVPSEDREAFMRENQVEDMSTRELKQAIEELKAEKARMQLTIDELMNAPAADPDEALREKADMLAKKMAGMELEARESASRIADLENDWKREREKVEGLKSKQQEREETIAKLEQVHREKEKTIQSLRDKLAKVSEPVVRTEDSPETLAKLERLKKEQADADAISNFKAGFEMMKRGLEMLEDALGRMDDEVRSRYTVAALKALEITQDKLG